MKRSMIAVVSVMTAVTAMMLSAGEVKADVITTYSIDNYPSYQLDASNNQYEVTGTIVWDLTTNTFQSASFTLQKDGGPVYSVTGAIYGKGDNSLPVSFTATDIELPMPANGVYADLYLSGTTADGYSANVGWTTYPTGTPEIYGYVGPGRTPHVMFGYAGDVPTGALPLVIATAVPEPATLMLLGSALLGLGAFSLRRRAKA